MNNRKWNSKNPYQTSEERVLCVCSAGLIWTREIERHTVLRKREEEILDDAKEINETSKVQQKQCGGLWTEVHGYE